MSLVLQRIEQTRDALVDALAERNWEAIGQLDLACRSCMEDVLGEPQVDEAALRINLEELLGCIGNCWRRRRESVRRSSMRCSRSIKHRTLQRFTICSVNAQLIRIRCAINLTVHGFLT